MPNDDPLNAKLIRRDDPTDYLSIFHVRPEDGEAPRFKPGQFVDLGLIRLPSPDDSPAARERMRKRTRLTRRAYSVGSSPLQRDHVEFFLVLVEGGKLTPRLWQMQPGDRMYMGKKPRGFFTLENIPPNKDLIMLATGTGLAPYISMLRTFRGQNRWRRCVVVHGVRYVPDLVYHEELLQMSREDPSIIYLPTVSREPEESDWPGLRGRVNAVLEDHIYKDRVGHPLDPDQCHVLLCGNPAMIDTVEQMLEARGFVTDTRKQPGNIHFERYW